MNFIKYLGCVFLLVGCATQPSSQSTGSNANAQEPAGLHEANFHWQDEDYSYFYYLPSVASADSKSPRPLVLVLHGGASNAKQIQSWSGMDVVAQKHGFIALYPNGYGQLDKFRTWNAGNCCGSSQQDRVDHVRYLQDLVTQFAQTHAIDMSRIYVTGMSNGGMMAYRMAAEAPEWVAAIAPVAGVMNMGRYQPKAPVPVLHFHSVDDARALYAGGLGPKHWLTGTSVHHEAVDIELRKWRDVNGCIASKTLTATVEKTVNDAAHKAEHWVWRQCNPDYPLELWKLYGPGHVWPGGEALSRPVQRILGPATDVINASELMWEFFKDKRR